MYGKLSRRVINVPLVILILLYVITLPTCLTQRQSRNTKTSNKGLKHHETRHLPLDPHRRQGEDRTGLVKSEFVTRKVKVVLSCEPEETVIGLNFTEPFRGLVLAGNTNSGCRIRGDGQLAYVLRVPHNSCDTEHVISKGSFVNKLFIRFHPSLEMGGDHSKTIVCKFGTGSFTIS